MPDFAGIDGLTYQDALRAVGWLIGREGYRHCRIVEQEGGVVLQVARAGAAPADFESFLLTGDDLLGLVRDSVASRAAPPPPPPAESPEP